MKKITTVLITLLLPLTLLFAQFNVEQPISWEASTVKIDDSTYEIILNGTMLQNEWHIYDMDKYDGGPNSTVYEVQENDNVKLIGKPYFKSSIKKEFDNVFNMNIGITEGDVILAQKVKVTNPKKASTTISVEWQACNNGSCLPPTLEEFTVTFNKNKKSKVAASSTTDDAPITPGNNSSLWGLILQAIAWGFIMLLTPCVFPMVPMTVSFFLRQNKDHPGKAKFQASMFGTFIVALYTLPIAIIILVTYFAGGEAVTADIFNFLATHWIPNLLFFLIFMTFAASFFGAFEIVLPSSLVNKADTKSNRGGLLGIFFMALTLVLVSFSCTGPIVGTVLIQSTQGAFWAPIVTMLAFSLAFSLPFTILAFSPSLLDKVPKGGGWMNTVKVVLGFIEVALGFKFLSIADLTYHWHLLDREVYLAIWIVVFTLLGFYLLGKLKFKLDSPVKYISLSRLVFAIISFSFVVYMIPGMWGAPLKALSGYIPPLTTQDFVLGAEGNNNSSAPYYSTPPTSQSASDSTNDNTEYVPVDQAKYSDFLKMPHGLKGYFDYKEAIAAGKALGKPIFLDFTGHGCVNCREMEMRVWSDPKVLEILRNDYVICSLYADDKTKVDEKEWVTTKNGKVLKTLGQINSYFIQNQFHANAQPFYVLLDAETQKMNAEPQGYNLNIDNFVTFLKKGIK